MRIPGEQYSAKARSGNNINDQVTSRDAPTLASVSIGISVGYLLLVLQIMALTYLLSGSEVIIRLDYCGMESPAGLVTSDAARRGRSTLATSRLGHRSHRVRKPLA